MGYFANLVHGISVLVLSPFQPSARLALSRLRSFSVESTLGDLKSFRWEDILPSGADHVDLTAVRQVPGNAELYEIAVLCCLIREYAFDTVLEIGTFDGRTTRNLAKFVGEAGSVTTVNLPEEEHRDEWIFDGGSVRCGERFLDAPESTRIRQVFLDSRRLDSEELGENFQLVFVDGSHSRDVVASDSMLASRVIPRIGCAVIVWHDFDFTDVREGVEQYLSQLEGGGSAYLLEGTRMGFQFLVDRTSVGPENWRKAGETEVSRSHGSSNG
jgi:predicted O-methyltransferase YrrM